MNWVSLGLYAALGLALGAAGVGVMDKPWQFIVIMTIVVCIEHSHRFN